MQHYYLLSLFKSYSTENKSIDRRYQRNEKKSIQEYAQTEDK